MATTLGRKVTYHEKIPLIKLHGGIESSRDKLKTLYFHYKNA